MTALAWDQVGQRFYQTGLDRGVLYLPDGSAVPWNGLTSVEETGNSELKPYYLDGVKYLQNLIPGDFTAKLKAITYPDEFDELNGIARLDTGLSFHDQPPKSFNLSYRTRVGNDLQGTDYGYKVHLLYNLLANPDSFSFDTLGHESSPAEFAWTLTGTPPTVQGYRPTVHISIDSNKTDSQLMQILEDTLYGTDIQEPRFPDIDEMTNLFGAFGVLTIIDNGDGTWTAVDLSDDYITMTDPTTFSIDNALVEILDASTYTISTTTPE